MHQEQQKKRNANRIFFDFVFRECVFLAVFMSEIVIGQGNARNRCDSFFSQLWYHDNRGKIMKVRCHIFKTKKKMKKKIIIEWLKINMKNKKNRRKKYMNYIITKKKLVRNVWNGGKDSNITHDRSKWIKHKSLRQMMFRCFVSRRPCKHPDDMIGFRTWKRFYDSAKLMKKSKE